jgi:hypothetical protein
MHGRGRVSRRSYFMCTVLSLGQLTRIFAILFLTLHEDRFNRKGLTLLVFRRLLQASRVRDHTLRRLSGRRSQTWR